MKIYVNVNAELGGNGTADRPFRHINDAAEIAKAGDEVLVAPGIYREYVNPVHAGTEDARISYRSTTPLGAVITGAEQVKNWEIYEGNVWVCRISNRIFGGYNPYTTFVYGDWYFAKADKHTGCVYLNDRALYETSSLEDCIKGEIYECSWVPGESVYKWYTEQDEAKDETIIYANFQGRNPNEENVEINVRRECFMPSETGIGYITVSGFNINKAATTWAPPAAFQDGMIGPHWSKGWIIEDCDISNSKCAGISVGKYLDPDNNHYFTYKYVKSPTQMERDAVCRGQYHGWLKEKVGGHIIRRNNIHHCEQGGIIGRMGGVFSVIEDNHIHHINNMMELGGAEIAGIKMHAAIDVIMRRNHIHHCTMGIWCDWEAQGTRLTQNLLHDNQRPAFAKVLKGGMMSQDIFVEVSHGPTLIDNNIMLSDASLRFATQGVAMVHNLICGALTCVGGGTGPRYTPYHIPHRTEVMGFMTVLHGDNRFYNNIFVQKWPEEDVITPHDSDDGFDTENRLAGTWMFDDYPTYNEWISQFDFSKPADMKKLEPAHEGHLPVWTEGNVYLGGAKACQKEVNGLTVANSRSDIKVELCEKDGNYYLDTNIYEFIDGFTGRMVNTDVLGMAFEPEEKFENPDGTPIQFDVDYFGEYRGTSVIPGPFADASDSKKIWNSKNTLDMERFTFRNILPEEADQAVIIEQICFPPNEACSEKNMKDRIARASELFLVAVDKETGKIAGFLNGLATDEEIFRDEFFTDASLYNPNGKNIMLLGLDVLPQYRRQGLATDIVKQYRKREQEKNRRKLILTCLQSKVEMYQKMGFEDNGIANSTWGGEEWHEMICEIKDV